MKKPKLFISTFTLQSRARRVWSVIDQGVPLTGLFDEDAQVLTAYRRFDKKSPEDSIPLWDGDRGAFVTWAERPGIERRDV